MDVLLLGTGSAEGWPDPFCSCASCAVMLAAGETRGQTAALIDDVLLLDCGPDSPRAATRAGRSLAGVRHLLLAHAHPAHVGSALLRPRSAAGHREPLDVAGPRDVLARCADWVGRDDPVRLVPVDAGDQVALGGYRVRALAAEPDGGRAVAYDVTGRAVHYDVTGPDGARLLYATSTGPHPDRTVETTAQASYDVVLLGDASGDGGTVHGALPAFPRVLADLRRRGAVDAHTDVVAVHLGHRNPPTAELARRLASWGARVVPDGTSVGPGAAPDAPVQARRTLVLGGARSGKSVEAERMLAAEPFVTYVATARPAGDDREWAERVAAHQRRRPPTWRTVETRDVASVIRTAETPVLVDCLTLWLADAMESGDHRTKVDELLSAWRDARTRVVAVTNEVGSGVVPGTPQGRVFRDELGRLNARVAAESEVTLLLVAGRVITL